MILLVDDDSAVTEVLARSLRGRGYDVAIAPSGATALECLAEVPAVMLLDINLPDMTGWDVLRAMTSEQRRTIPVIALSASPLSKTRVLEFAPAGVLTKPFPLDGLCTLIARLTHPSPEPEDLPPSWRQAEEV